MGCYDVLFLAIECPYCERESLIEFQTKDMDSVFDIFRKGDRIPEGCNHLEYLDCIGDCHSPECRERADKDWIIAQGSPSGCGLLFNVKVELKVGVVTGKIFNIRKNEKDLDKHIEENKDKWEGIYVPRKDDSRVLKQFKEIK